MWHITGNTHETINKNTSSNTNTIYHGFAGVKTWLVVCTPGNANEPVCILLNVDLKNLGTQFKREFQSVIISNGAERFNYKPSLSQSHLRTSLGLAFLRDLNSSHNITWRLFILSIRATVCHRPGLPLIKLRWFIYGFLSSVSSRPGNNGAIIARKCTVLGATFRSDDFSVHASPREYLTRGYFSTNTSP